MFALASVKDFNSISESC